MSFFAPGNATKSVRHRHIYAFYELAYTLVDVIAAGLFMTGSIMFFNEALKNQAIWCFVIGSAFFGLKPTLRLIREFHYLAIGDIDALARRAGQ